MNFQLGSSRMDSRRGIVVVDTILFLPCPLVGWGDMMSESLFEAEVK